jgi:hypothetical protein
MLLRPRLTAILASAVAGLTLLVPATLFAVNAKTDPAAPPIVLPAPVDPAWQGDVKKLQEAIKRLYESYEAQGKILDKNSDALSGLAYRVENISTLIDSLRTGLTTLAIKTTDLKDAQGRLATAQETQAAETAARFREIAAAVADLQAQLAKSDQAADANLANLRLTIAASRTPALGAAPPSDNQALLLPLLGAMAAATLILAAFIFLSGRSQRRNLEAAQAHLEAVLAQARALPPTEPDAGYPAQIRSTPVASETGAAADHLAEIHAKLQNLVDQLNPPAPPVHNDDHTTKGSPFLPPDEQATVRLPVLPASGIPSSACWPAAFFDAGSPLTSWRERIESHLASTEHPAMPVLSAFLSLRTLCARQPAPLLPEVGTAVVALSEALYAYVDSLTDLPEDDRARASSDWIPAVKALTSVVAPKLEIREVIAGTRFDADSMQTVRQGSGNHLSVAAVLSWATLDRSGERVKVLQRARIATN